MSWLCRTSLARAILAMLLLGALPAAAEPVTLRYTATWAGLPAAEIHLRLDEGNSDFRSQIDIRTEGVPRWFTRFKAHGISEGAVAADGLAAPRRYDAYYDLRSRKDKRISMHFLPDGIAERGAEDSTEKPQIAIVNRTGVVDPLTALNRMREAIRTGAAQRGNVVIPVYDGKRRFDVAERGLTHETVTVAGVAQRVFHLRLVLLAVAGFKDNDPEGTPDSGPRAMDVLFSDDGNIVPLRMEVQVGWFTMAVNLAQHCVAEAPCKVAFQ
jgi:hypothetical protein